MKVLLFVGFLVVVLVMLSMNVIEGNNNDPNDKQIDDDKAEFEELYNKAKDITQSGGHKDRGTKLKNLKFEKGSGDAKRLEDLIRKYKHSENNKKDVTDGLNIDEAKEKLTYRKKHNS